MKRLFVLIIFALSFICILSGCSEGIDKNIKHYLKSGTYMDAAASEMMPSLESLPEYKDINYQYYFHNDYTRSMLLAIKYDKQTYDSEKQKLDGNYTFLDHAVEYNNEGDYIIPEYAFTIGNYNFRVVEYKGDVNSYFPHSFEMIVTSDEKNSVAYLYFYDQSLDLISLSEFPTTMSEFIEDNFPYQW
jgi:hypothetical protein